VSTKQLDREIVRLAVPALGALIAEPLYILVDTAVVGHLGTEELGGLAVAGTLLVTGYSLFIFLAYGTTGTVARLLGAGDRAGAAHQGVQGVWLAGLVSIALVVLGAVFAGPLVDVMGADGEVRTHALTYFRVSLAGVPALLLGLAGTGYLRGLQDTRTPLVVAVGSNVVNLVLELTLIYGLGMGIGASAAATVFAQWLATAVYLRILLRAVRAEQTSVRPDARALRRLARVSVDLFVRTASLRGALLIATAVAARLGTVQLGAHQVAFELWNFLALALDALAIAGQAMTGRFLGAGDAEAARAAARRMLQWGLVAGLALGVVVAALSGVLPHVFTDDERVIDQAATVLWFVAVLQPLNSVVFVLDGVLIGAGDVRFLAWAMAAATLAFIPLALAVVAADGGLAWLWAALGVFMAARGAGLWLRYAGTGWQVTGAG
jgi:putative MATE family efflux protein